MATIKTLSRRMQKNHQRLRRFTDYGLSDGTEGWMTDFYPRAEEHAHTVEHILHKGEELYVFTHYLFDPDMECWWSFDKKLVVNLAQHTISVEDGTAEGTTLTSRSSIQPEDREAILSLWISSPINGCGCSLCWK